MCSPQIRGILTPCTRTLPRRCLFQPSISCGWLTSLTYIRLREQFVYLAVILDACSRRVIGWELQDGLRAELALRALDRALANRAIAPGIVHHSDRGAQYCSDEYVGKLGAHGFRISMSRSGNPYDNALAESFIKTLKVEEVYVSKYRDIEDARTSIQQFLECVYNERRIHSSLSYTSPAQFEAARPPNQEAP
jgi:putative transposase